jgi:shikimate kinase
MEKNLFLIGYRGTGKTFLGKIIAEKLGRDFVDTDELIIDLAGKSIPEIFSQDGEEKFREWETKALTKACEKEGRIISCGGGVVTQERNFPLLKTGVVCLLKSNAKTIFDRIYGDGNRPSLTDKDPLEEIVHLLAVRAPLYERAKDFEIETSINDHEKYTDEIISKFNEVSN